MDLEEKLKTWARLLQQTRTYLEGRGFLEVTTPYLVPAGAFEASIDAPQVHFQSGSPELHSSPEMEMKVLLARLRRPIYQIARCFRDDPPSPIHGREFTMLELYRPQVGYEAILAATIGLFETLAGGPLPWKRFSIAALFQEQGIDLRTAKTREDLRRQIAGAQVCATDPTDTWNDLFFRVLIEKIEPRLPGDFPVVLDQYPVAVSPLSQAAPGGEFAERFEIYWHGMELCNGCTELRDPVELKQRWEQQKAERSARKASDHPYPERLFAALELGLPPCAGVAIGMDRLFLSLLRDRGETDATGLVLGL